MEKDGRFGEGGIWRTGRKRNHFQQKKKKKSERKRKMFTKFRWDFFSEILIQKKKKKTGRGGATCVGTDLYLVTKYIFKKSLKNI